MRIKYFIKSVFIVSTILFFAGCNSPNSDNSSNPPDPFTEYTISYYTEHGTTPRQKKVYAGYALKEEDLQPLTFNDYEFDFWEISGFKVTPGFLVTDNIILKAQWTKNNKVSKPYFSSSDSIDYGDKITILTKTSNAEIFYTTDGKTPDKTSTKYSAPIEIKENTTIKAIAYKDGLETSEVSEKNFTLKVYTINFIVSSYGKCNTAQLTGKHKSEAVTLPDVIPVTNYRFDGWQIGTKTYSAGSTYIISGNTEATALLKSTAHTHTLQYGGGLIGTAFENADQGDPAINLNWMDTDGKIRINGSSIPFTQEVIAVPYGTYACTNTIISIFDSKYKLSPFTMGKYPVTKRFYKAVMGSLPEEGTVFNAGMDHPVTDINWFDAIIFCNKLSSLCGLTPAYSYTIDGKEETDPDKWISKLGAVPTQDSLNASSETEREKAKLIFEKWNKVNINLSATGYRLPTECEWEFCARGGDPNIQDANKKMIWNYIYSGSDTISEVAHYNISNMTAQVGSKKANRLGIYDMSGNVWEWCNDYRSDKVTHYGKTIGQDGYYLDVHITTVNDARRLRGGTHESSERECRLDAEEGYSRQASNAAYRVGHGIRLVRHLDK